MIQISKKDKEKVLEAIHSGKIDTAELALPALADSIVLAMKHHGFLEPLNDVFEDKRSDRLHIPLGYTPDTCHYCKTQTENKPY